jgi:hypothetical protein
MLFLICLVIVSGAAVTLAAVPLSVSLNTVSINAGGNGNRVYVMPNASISGTTLYSMAVYLSGRRELANAEFLSFDKQLNSITQAAPPYDASAGVLSFTGAGSPSTYAAILRTITYQDNNPNPLAGARTIRVDVSDGTNTASAAMTVNVIGGGTSALTINLNNSFPVNSTGNGKQTLICPYAVLSGPTLTSMAVYLAGQRDGANELLSSSNWGLNAISRSAGGQAGAYLRFSGSGSPSDYAAVLRTITYQDNSANATAGVRTVTVSLTAGATSISARMTVNVIGTSVIKPGSSITLGSPSGPVTGSGTSVLVCPSAAIFTTSPLLWSMAVYLTPHPDGAQESLRFNGNLSNVTTSYDAAAAVLSVTGGASLSVYQTILRSITYQDNKVSPTAGPRTITVVVSDGTTSFSASTIVNVISARTPAPALYLDGTNPNYATSTYGGSNWYAHISPNATVSYPGYLTSATITLTNPLDGIAESLGVQGLTLGSVGLSSSGYNANTGRLMISGRATPSTYQAALESVIYVDANTNPHTATRYISVSVADNVNNVSSMTDIVTMSVQRRPVILPATGNTYYVSSMSGDDYFNNGRSEKTPWQTIDRVNRSIRGDLQPRIMPGDTIRFKRGEKFPISKYEPRGLVWVGSSRAAQPTTTIRDYGDNPSPPLIDAQDGNGIFVLDAGNFEIFNLEIKGNYDNPAQFPGSVPDPFYPANRNGIYFTNSTALGTKEGLSIHDVKIHGFAADQHLANVSGCGIFIDGGAPKSMKGGYDGITIYNCEIHHNASAAIEMGPESMAPSETPDKDPTFTNVFIRHINAHHNVPPRNALPDKLSGTVAGGEAVHLVGVDGGVVEYCQASYNGNAQLPHPDRGVAFICQYSHHILFQYNEAHHQQTNFAMGEGGRYNFGDEGGFDFDIFTFNSIMQFNYSHDNDGYGYMFGATFNGVSSTGTSFLNVGNIIRFNISMNDCGSAPNATGKSTFGSLLFEDWPITNAYVYNNTFYMRNNGLASLGSDYIAPVVRFDANGSPPGGQRIHVYNNLLLTDGVAPYLTNTGNFPLGNVMFQGNVVYNGGGAAPPIVNGQPLGYVADPRLQFENNPLAAPSITNIGKLGDQLVQYFKLDPARAPDYIKRQGAVLGTVITMVNNWWTPDPYWAGVLGLPAHDFFGISLPLSGGTFSIGASQSP